jgi:pSer/pThr/pTyr-binding forkhead associated (FHA) protein
LREGQFTCQALLIEGEFGPEPEVAPPAGESPSGAELVLIEDGQRSKIFPLERDRVIIGRLADSDVVLSDPGASRRHAEIRRENGQFVLQDLGSTNGTLVNDEAVDERTLQEGDRIGIGRTVLEFRRR